MKSYLKALIVLTIFSYFNLMLLNYQIRTDGLESIHPFWTISILFSAIATLIGFTETLKHIRRFTFLDLLLKISIIFIAFRATNAVFDTYLILNILTIPLFIANILVESFMIIDYNRYLEDKEIIDISYIKMIEETQKNPELSYDIQVKYINAIKYTRTVANILTSSFLLIIAVAAAISILKYHDLIAGILLGITIIVSLVIFLLINANLFKNHLRIKSSQNKRRIYLNLVLTLILYILIGATIAVVSIKELSTETYLVIILWFALMIPIAMTNNRIATIWLDKINKKTLL